MKPTVLSVSCLLAIAMTSVMSRAADGLWANPAGGSWANAANWSAGTIADGTNALANFTTLTLGSNATVTLDGTRTVGTLAFGDVGSTYSWTLGPGSSGPLTLAVSSGTPVISNSVATLIQINTGLAGNQGFIRKAAGANSTYQVLITSSNPGLSGAVNLGSGALTAITDPLSLGTGRIIFGSNPGDAQDWLVAAGTDLTLTNNIEIRSIRALVGNQTVGGLAPGKQTWNGNVVLNHANQGVHDFYAQTNLTINGTISEAIPNQECIFTFGTITVNGPITSSGAVIVNGAALTSTTLALNGPIRGTNGLTVNGGTPTLAGTNTYTGGTTVNGGNLYLANPSGNAIPAGIIAMQGGGRIYLSNSNQIDDSCVLQFNKTPLANSARLDLTGFNETIAGIDDFSTNGSPIVEAATDGVTNKPATLTLNVPTGQTHTHTSFIRNGTGTGSILSVIKDGAGQQTFSGTSGQVGYTGLTTIKAGILEVSGASSALINSPVNLAGGTLLVSGTSGTGLRAQPLTNNLSVAGTLHKTGGGVLQLGSATTNIFTGTTIVDGGTLQVQAGGILGSNAAVVNGGTLEILGSLQATSTTVNPGGTLVSGNSSTFTSEVSGPVTNSGGIIRGWAILDNVTIQSGTINPAIGTTAATLTISNLTCQGGTLAFDLNPSVTTTGGGVNDLLAVSTLTLSAPALIDLPNVTALTGSRYVIMTYSALVGSPSNLYLNPAIGGLRSQPSIDTSTPGEIAIVFANPGAVVTSLTWAGGMNGNAWDVGTSANWLDSGLNSKTFYSGDTVTFNDTSTNPAINLAGTVYPALLSFNNTTNYVISGAGAIISSAGLNQTAGGNVTLNVPFAGAGVTNSGVSTLSLTNATISSQIALGAGSTMVLRGSNSLTGGFAMDTSLVGSTVILTNGGYLNATVGATFVIPQSSNLVVVAGAGSALNAPGAGVAVANAPGATSDRVILRDGGAWTNIGNNFSIPSGANAFNNALIITNGGRFAFDPATTGNLLLGQGANSYSNTIQINGASSVMDLSGRSFYCGRKGTNNIATVDAGVIANCGSIPINDNGTGKGNGLVVRNGGSVSVSGGVLLGGNAGSVGAFVTVDNATLAAVSANIGVNASATGTALTLTNNGSFTLSGTLTMTNASSTVSFSGGTMSLGGATVSNGLSFTVGDGTHAATLALSGGSYNFANDLNISANATLEGNGTVGTGNVTVSGSLQPGASVGALTVNNNLTLAGTTVMEIDMANSTNDSITVLGTIAYGGTLTVTNLGGTLAAGDTFKLFNFTGSPGSFSGTPSLPTLGSGLAWTNKLSVDGTIAVVATSVTPPTLVYSKVAPNQLQFSWTGAFKLQWLTNSASVGLRTNATSMWMDYPGGASSPVTVTNNLTIPTAFFRLSQ